MGILVAVLIFVAGGVGAGAKAGVFKKGYDTTAKDTYAFEKNALEENLAMAETKERKVVELGMNTPESTQMTAELKSKTDLIKSRIGRIEDKENKMGWND